MVRCKASTKKGNQCLNNIKSAGDSFCNIHSKTTPKCKGTNKKTSEPCGNISVENGYCKVHNGLDLCKSKLRDSSACGNKRLQDGYCGYHFPDFENSTIPEVFRINSLRSDRYNEVLGARAGNDAYTKSPVSTQSKLVELDHVFELHLGCCAFDTIKKQGTNFIKSQNDLKYCTKKIFNINENLNLTSTDYNQAKFLAMSCFGRDFRFNINKVNEQGLFHYLHQQETVNKYDGKLTRRVSGNIQKEVKLSFDHIISKYEDEKALEAEMMVNLHDMMVAMKLE